MAAQRDGLIPFRWWMLLKRAAVPVQFGDVTDATDAPTPKRLRV
jgi:hypothetical protein